MQTSTVESIRKQIDSQTTTRPPLPTSVDLPLSNDSKRALAYAAEEAERLAHRHIDTQHLLLGLLRVDDCFAAAMLRERGLALEQIRQTFAKASADAWPTFDTSRDYSARLRRFAGSPMVNIHGASWNADYVYERVKACREYSWHWQKKEHTPRDIVIHRDNARISFDLSLAKEPKQFHLAKGAWTKDHCVICRWELTESSDPQHSTGYTNGRDWVCTECYEKFLQGPDYFATAHPEIT